MKHNTLTDDVTDILKRNPATRNSDRALFAEIVQVYSKMYGFPLERVDLFFTRDFKKEGIPDYESVGRARRKIQEENPELRADKEVAENRMYREDQFMQFAMNLRQIPG